MGKGTGLSCKKQPRLRCALITRQLKTHRGGGAHFYYTDEVTGQNLFTNKLSMTMGENSRDVLNFNPLFFVFVSKQNI